MQQLSNQINTNYSFYILITMKEAKRWWRSVNIKSDLLSRYYGDIDYIPSDDDIMEMYNEEMMSVEY
jgi:hypothetical protein